MLNIVCKFSFLAARLCMGWPVWQAAIEAGDSNRGALILHKPVHNMFVTPSCAPDEHCSLTCFLLLLVSPVRRWPHPPGAIRRVGFIFTAPLEAAQWIYLDGHKHRF